MHITDFTHRISLLIDYQCGVWRNYRKIASLYHCSIVWSCPQKESFLFITTQTAPNSFQNHATHIFWYRLSLIAWTEGPTRDIDLDVIRVILPPPPVPYWSSDLAISACSVSNLCHVQMDIYQNMCCINFAKDQQQVLCQSQVIYYCWFADQLFLLCPFSSFWGFSMNNINGAITLDQSQ